MKKYKHVVIESSIEPSGIEQILRLKESPVLKAAEKITLIHIYNKDMESYLPKNINKTEIKEIEEHIISTLDSVKKQLGYDNITTYCILSSSPKIHAVEHLKSIEADLVVTATKGNHGITYFNRNDSFSYHLIENSPCDIYVIRP